MLSDIRGGKRKYDIVLCWALDRLTRGGPAAVLNLIDAFKLSGVKVVSLQESWTEAPGIAGDILFAVAGWAARMESERRSERTKAGLERVRKYGSKSGRPCGRPKGSKDKEKRRRSGYLSRWVNKGSGKTTPAIAGVA